MCGNINCFQLFQAAIHHSLKSSSPFIIFEEKKCSVEKEKKEDQEWEGEAEEEEMKKEKW